jgi:KUP system potassium uptake protein
MTLLTVGALGVVFGDIGTSPLYALRECFLDPHSVSHSEANVLGVLSLIFWSLMLVVSLKYAWFLLRTDNNGEGGILALLALITGDRQRDLGKPSGFVILGLVGAAFLYADAAITPAISVLSAVEGLSAITPRAEPFIVPIATAILVGLFLVQQHGTAAIGSVFGPLMLIWFVVLGLLGALSIADTPGVLAAMSPHYALQFFLHNGWRGFAVLGIVFLVVTGGEALYADMGHFGRLPIRYAWFGIALPGVLLNYFGQGALLIRSPEVIERLYFALVPPALLLPLVILATLATIVASQAVISGAFSLTSQAVQLGYLPRLNIRHTSDAVAGQIYIPLVNWVFLIMTVALVIYFRDSGNLAAAYGLAVATAMVVTSLYLYRAARRVWKWGPTRSLLLAVPLVILHLVFLIGTLPKIPTGGWFPLLAAGVIYLLIATWYRGQRYLSTLMAAEHFPVEAFLDDLEAARIARVPGAAVYLCREPTGIPRTLLHNLKHNKVLHEKVILMTVSSEDVPRMPRGQRAQVESLSHGFYRVVLRYGFSEHPNVAPALYRCLLPYFPIEAQETTFFLGHQTLLVSPRNRMPMSTWRRHFYVWLARNSLSAARFFHIPANRVVELGAQFEI